MVIQAWVQCVGKGYKLLKVCTKNNNIYIFIFFSCNSKYPTDCGAFCAVDNGQCAQKIFAMVGAGKVCLFYYIKS
jgi:hypothetical protein